MRRRNAIGAVCAALLLAGGGATMQAQSVAGVWEGSTGGRTMFVSLDSGSTGWSGRLFVRSFRQDTIPFVSVIVKGDSVTMQLPAEALGALLRGVVAADRVRLGGYIVAGSDSSQLFRLARVGTPAAAQLVALATPRPSSEKTRALPDPDSARLVTSDITLFWSLLDRSTPETLEPLLAEYLDKGSPGLRDFIPGRILSAADLTRQVQLRRARYDGVRGATLRITEAEPAIRAAFRRFKDLYADAVFPDVYFVIGRFNSGGTASSNGLLIGAEMYSDPTRLPSIVSHELIHFQQIPLGRQPTLLEQSFREGSADFVGELISGMQINNEAHRYGMAHERELWAEFQQRTDTTSYTGWMYGDPPGERPADLGYFIGYRIAQAYYAAQGDKRAALRDIVRGTDVTGILSRSAYRP